MNYKNIKETHLYEGSIVDPVPKVNPNERNGKSKSCRQKVKPSCPKGLT